MQPIAVMVRFAMTDKFYKRDKYKAYAQKLAYHNMLPATICRLFIHALMYTLSLGSHSKSLVVRIQHYHKS